MIPRTEADSAAIGMSTWQWILAAALFGLTLVIGIRQGGFWFPTACIAGAGSLVLLAAAAVTNPLHRRSLAVVAALALFVVWWGVRARASGSWDGTLPLGATCLAFASSFAVVRTLRGASRQVAGMGVACLGAIGALVGLAGLIWRWFPMAMPAQGLWRLSTTLTYSDAAGLALGMCLLVAFGVDRYPRLVRVAVCLCTAALLATQSRGALVAVVCACAVVPWRRYMRFVAPLSAGVVLGAVAIATSPDSGPVPGLGVAVVASLAFVLAPESLWRPLLIGRGARVIAMCIVVMGAIAVTLVMHHEIGLRALSPSDHDRFLEWTSAWQQWQGDPLFGVGPDRLLVLHTSDGSYARFVHNEYLQVAADAGVIGLALVTSVVVAVIRAIKRYDALSSCACAALLCCAVGAAFDYDWHLPFVGFLGGCCVGLAAASGRTRTAASAGEEARQYALGSVTSSEGDAPAEAAPAQMAKGT